MADKIDPIKKTKEVDAKTGAITYRHEWSNAIINKPSASKPSQGTILSNRSKTTSGPSKSTTSGSREITTIVPMAKPQIAPKIGSDSKLEAKKPRTAIESRNDSKENVREKQYSQWKKPNETRSDYDKRIEEATKKNAAKNKDNSAASRSGAFGAGGGCGCS